MSNLSTFAEVGLIDARASSGTLIVPNSCDIPGRVITYKDLYGATGNSTIALLASTGDVFEDGTNFKILQNAYDFITLYAASTNVWSIIGGTQVNAFRANIMSNTSNITSSIITNTINSATVFTSFLYPQTGLTFTTTSNLIPPANATTTGSAIGQITSNYFQVFTQSTVTSNITAGTSALSSILTAASITPAYSTFRISTISLGTNTNRYFQGFFVSTITSTINADFTSSVRIATSTITSVTMTLDGLFNGPIATATTTQNLYPFNVGALVGFGSNTAQNGFYAEGHFRSTFTQVIQPTLDDDGFSNVVLIRGITSTPQVFTSTVNAVTFLSSATLNLHTGTALLGVLNNAVTGRISITNTAPLQSSNIDIGNTPLSNYFRNIYTFSTTTDVIQGQGTTGATNINSAVRVLGTLSSMNLNVSTLTTNFITASSFFVSTLITNSISTGVLNISSFNINALSAGTLIVSTINFQNISTATGFISSLNVNSLTFGSGTGYADFTALRAGLVSSIQSDTGTLNVSSINSKVPAFWSTLNIPASSFSITGSSANNPIVLYSNVQFPPYTKGLYKVYQKSILTKLTGGAGVDARASILYSQGTFPSTVLFHDGFSSLPYVNANSISSYTTCVTTVLISSITTRNICYFDQAASAYTANLFMGNLAVEYIPSLGFSSDVGQNYL